MVEGIFLKCKKHFQTLINLSPLDGAKMVLNYLRNLYYILKKTDKYLILFAKLSHYKNCTHSDILITIANFNFFFLQYTPF